MNKQLNHGETNVLLEPCHHCPVPFWEQTWSPVLRICASHRGWSASKYISKYLDLLTRFVSCRTELGEEDWICLYRQSLISYTSSVTVEIIDVSKMDSDVYGSTKFKLPWCFYEFSHCTCQPCGSLIGGNSCAISAHRLSWLLETVDDKC